MILRRGRNLANALVSVYLCALFALPFHGQTNKSPQQRMDAVQNHLLRYAIIRGSNYDGMTLNARMEALAVPAVSIAVIRNGAIDWAQAYGDSSIGGAPVSIKTLFGAASLSKPVTALGVLKLVEEGKIDLDANVNQ